MKTAFLGRGFLSAEIRLRPWQLQNLNHQFYHVDIYASSLYFIIFYHNLISVVCAFSPLI